MTARVPPVEGRLVEARRLSSQAGAAALGDFTYTVVLGASRPETPPAAGAERRRGSRHRTRLRSGKIVDEAGRFVTECLVHDLSPSGGRLRLAPGTELPRTVQVYDDQSGLLHRATVLWRRDRDVGVAFEAPREDPRGRALAEALRRKFYAVRD